ncbi:hypothetical protein DFO73_101581 [Cytobacillus oceanisediminis]|uniref:STAS domain-containing protein n=1 Tax=Cytobacillus oceanisediminis TaxID=665099 RepID=A0A2V3A5E9_9BACI|nr:ATP-binding protein [Cytobacillus oceanisediminis]PWW32317.1 hypothetical protein DFO73_101581 [Cytobacillus oceanisediminis]
MNKIKVPAQLSTIIEVNSWLNVCSDVYYSNKKYYILDLHNLKWISPLGCTVLLSSIEKLTSNKQLAIIPPFNADLIGYLTRMKFFDLCPSVIKRQFEESSEIDLNYYKNRRTNDRSDELLEISKTQSEIDVAKLSKRIYKIMQIKNIPPSQCSDVMSYISELGSNATDHGSSSCYSAVQYYPSTGEISISISDSGLGIYNTLKSNFPYSSKDEVIEAAIFTTATRYKEQQRGKGLPDVKRRVLNTIRGKISFRTHDSIYNIQKDQLKKTEEGKWFFGTYFHIQI